MSEYGVMVAGAAGLVLVAFYSLEPSLDAVSQCTAHTYCTARTSSSVC